MSSSDRLRQILNEHEKNSSPKQQSEKNMSSFTYSRPISPTYHETTTTLQQSTENKIVPRAYLQSDHTNTKTGKITESHYASYYADQSEPEPESSILVSKVPTANPVQKPSQLYSTVNSANKKVTIWPLGTTVHRLPVYELEKQLKKMKPSQVTSICLDLAAQLRTLELQFEKVKKQPTAHISSTRGELAKINEVDEEELELKYSESVTESSISGHGRTRCRYSVSGCPFKLPSMQQHEDRECSYRPTRCPSLTCTAKAPFVKLLKHITEEHDGSQKGKDRVCRNNTNHLVSSYVNVDKEPIFYKNSTMTWVANELILEAKFHFFLECMRVPPDWHLWVYFLGDDHEAEKFQVTITLFREEEYGRMGDSSAFSAQRSYTGPVLSINRAKEEIAEFGLGFMVHDKQIRSLCGSITSQEEQLFGYEVTVYRK